MSKIIVIGGQTATGKSKLAVELAKKINGIIINGDSMQVYKEMNIGTAKIKEEGKGGISHYLFDIVSVKDSFSVAEYKELATKKINEIIEQKRVPIIVGGTGLYLRSVLYDYDFNKEIKNDSLAKYGDKTNQELYDLLKKYDLDSALQIHPNNRKRVLRAISIYESSGKTKTYWLSKQKHKLAYDCLFIGLTMDRKNLYNSINKRVDEMFLEGLEAEVRTIIKSASPNSTCLQAIGYKEFIPYFSGLINKEQLVELIKKNTRRYAKRQYTFFNNQFKVTWYDTNTHSLTDIVNKIIIDYQGGKNDK
ncbi:MAG: tRNA (adenosine(37)-N6)-dimethylallyltransferase MiaA [Bacilli bacterium]|nr:tRNA (adenosine(37)-N6)-dimethylallyltransferase MiaA [Bacilli bacterium]